MSREMDRSFSELRNISSQIGNNIDFVQGAGGNTSLKENNTLWVKASGCWLSDSINKNIFVPVDREEVTRLIESNNLSDLVVKNVDFQKEYFLHPSIETALHALMPHKFVLHIHAVNTLSIAVLSNGKKYVERLLQDINWVWIPYVMPGIQLAKAIQNAMHAKPDVIILANHGLVVGGKTSQETLQLLMHVEEKLKRKLRSTTSTNKDRLLAISKSKYRLPKYEIVQTIANDDLALKIVETGTLYPDHVVFLGAGPMNILSIDELESIINKPRYVDNSPVIIVRDYGVIVHHDLGENAEAMLYCLASILLRIQPDEKLCYLTQENEMDLMGWDAEKYRQSIQR
jgi:rhamnose utilization protein RhaD (predicted bifunctional aldolase and dehydrogenase)